ncbi:MAG: esterase-like activity of phytase family protein [Candidatus Binatia bacterium]
MGPRRQIVSALAALLALEVIVACHLTRASSPSSGTIEVRAFAVDVDPRNPDRKQIGKLVFLSGFELKSSDRRFGGLSGLWINEESLLALSDRGYWISARARHDADGRLAEFGDWKIDRLLAPDGKPVRGRLADSEGLTRDQDGFFIVSFEQAHRLWRYAPTPATFASKPVPIPVPARLTRARANGGVECVAALGDGRLIILTETLRNADGSLAGGILEKEQFHSLSYVPSADFAPSDCAVLKNGDLLVLERQIGFLGSWSARIKRVPGDSLRPGARLEGTEIARLALPLAVDNFEGIAVYEHPQAGTFVYLVSDDNYLPFERTLLLQFLLRP